MQSAMSKQSFKRFLLHLNEAVHLKKPECIDEPLLSLAPEISSLINFSNSLKALAKSCYFKEKTLKNARRVSEKIYIFKANDAITRWEVKLSYF